MSEQEPNPASGCVLPRNPFSAGCDDWWRFEIGRRLHAHATAAAELGATGRFGVFVTDMPSAEGGFYRPLPVDGDKGDFVLVTCNRSDWLEASVSVRNEARINLWQFAETVALSAGESVSGVSDGLLSKLDVLLRRAVNRLAFEADGLRCFARVGLSGGGCPGAESLTVGIKIDSLQSN